MVRYVIDPAASSAGMNEVILLLGGGRGYVEVSQASWEWFFGQD
jgi:hypothetical protein